jgi:SPP1 family predicted phage head-tail adaptor
MSSSRISNGSMRHRILVERVAQTSDGQGGFTRGSWSTYFAAFAKIEPLSAREMIFAGQRAMGVTHKVTLRYRFDKLPTVEMRINFTIGSTIRIFQILGVTNVDERNDFWTLLCKEGVGA